MVDYSVQFVLPKRQAWYDLAYTDVLPAGTQFVSMSSTSCVHADMTACATIPTLTGTPSVQSNGTTPIGWWFGDLGDDDQDRTITLKFKARLVADDANSAPLLPGDIITNTVNGYSNSDNRIDDSTTPTTPVTAGDYTSIAEANTVVVQPNLLIMKLAEQTGPLASGDPISWSVVITNNGTSPAYGISVKDTPNAAVENVVAGQYGLLVIRRLNGIFQCWLLVIVLC